MLRLQGPSHNVARGDSVGEVGVWHDLGEVTHPTGIPTSDNLMVMACNTVLSIMA